MRDWETLGGIEAGKGSTFNIGKSSPVFVLGVILIISPWLLELMFAMPGWLKTILTVVGIFVTVIGAVLSMLDR